MNIPNRLTILRVFLIPVFVVIFYLNDIPGNEYIALGIYIVACVTDFFDGRIARKNNLITNFGKFMDPLADKLLVNIAIICFVTTPGNPLPVWVAMVIIARDFVIDGFRLIASDNGVVIAADMWGKFKTASQMIMVCVLIVNIENDVMNIVEYILIYVSAALTVISLLDCIIRNSGVLKNSINNTVKTADKAKYIIKRLTKTGKTITFAESCTGGLLCSSFIEHDGASVVIKESIVTYCNHSKIKRLGVDEKIIDTYTEVSDETAVAMAAGARSRTGSDIAVSITGVAGPNGGTKEIPVGTVYIGISSDKGDYSVKSIFEGTRNNIRNHAVDKAMDMILELVGKGGE